MYGNMIKSNSLGNSSGSASIGALNAKISIFFFFFFFFLNKHLFYEVKHTSISNFAALVTHKTSRQSYPHALLILPNNFSICSVYCWLH